MAMHINDFGVKIEGYWKATNKSCKLPMPMPNQLLSEQAENIYHLIKKLERSAYKVQYRGPSMSRIEKNVIVGSAEFSKDGWAWPAGFAEHYVLKHRVRPSDEFLQFIGYEQ